MKKFSYYVVYPTCDCSVATLKSGRGVDSVFNSLPRAEEALERCQIQGRGPRSERVLEGFRIVKGPYERNA